MTPRIDEEATLRNRTTARVLLLLLFCGGLAWAQPQTTGTIAGRVTDEDGAPLPGTTVTLRSVQGSRIAIVDSAGQFLAPHLTPGTYDVRAELAGFRTVEQREVHVNAGQRVDVELVLPQGSFEDTIEVAGSSPIIDYATASGGAVIEGSFLAQVPVQRRLSGSFYLAPGVSSGGSVGDDNPSISGASGLENRYLVDGLSINDPRKGGLGVYNSSYDKLGTGVTFDFVEEVQVLTSGADAEFSQSTGGVVSVVTKSGSNEWTGTAFSFYQPDSLEADRKRIELTEGAVYLAGTDTKEAGFTLGGPLARDRAFIFAAANPQWDTTTLEAPEGFPLADVGGVDRDRRVTAYAAKLTYLLSGSHRVDVSAYGDPATIDNGPQASDTMLYRDTSAFSSLEYGGHNQTVNYQGTLSNSWLLEAAVGRSASYLRERPSVDEWEIIDETTSPSTLSGGKGSYNPADDGEVWQVNLKSTNLVGKHEIRYGVSWEDTTYDNARGATGPTFILPDGRETGTGGRVNIISDPVFGKIYRASRTRLEDVRTASIQHLGLFVQDRVYGSRNLTVVAGVRYESQHLEGGRTGFTFDDNWAPRLAATWDPTGEGRMKVSASAGYFYAKIPANLALLAMNSGTRVLRADYYDAGLTQPIPEGVDAGGTTTHFLLNPGGATTIEPNARVTYIREGTLGFEYELAPSLNVGARFVYRDMPRVLEDLGNAAIILFFDPDSGVDSLTYVIGNPRDGHPATANDVGAFEEPIHRYRALELTANKRFADNWTFLGSYRWSRLWGTYEGYYNNDTGSANPAQSSLNDFPTNDPTYAEIGGPTYGFRGDIRFQGRAGAGPLPTDRPHQLKLYGAYMFDFGTTLGFGFQAASGRPLTAMATNPVLNRQGDIPETPRGSGFVTEDGFKRRTPATWTLDFHVDHAFRLGGGRLVVLADVFNLFDQQKVLMYDQNTELRAGRDNPDFGKVIARQDPRQVRLGVRFEL